MGSSLALATNSTTFARNKFWKEILGIFCCTFDSCIVAVFAMEDGPAMKETNSFQETSLTLDGEILGFA